MIINEQEDYIALIFSKDERAKIQNLVFYARKGLNLGYRDFSKLPDSAKQTYKTCNDVEKELNKTGF